MTTNLNKIYIGIDNGTSGSIAIISQDHQTTYFEMPSKKEQNYTKGKDGISRIDFPKLITLFQCIQVPTDCKPLVILERPFVDPGMFKTSGRALRSLEAVLIAVEYMGWAHMYCDSKNWQRVLLPNGVKKKQLKKASKDIGLRLFPECEAFIKKQGDADGLLIAEWARRNNL